MVEFVGYASAACVDVRLHAFEIFEVVGDDRAALTGCNQLAGLKAERTQISDRSRTLAAPHTAMRVGAVFHDLDSVFGG